MDELQAFVGALLANDATLKAIFATAGHKDAAGVGVAQVVAADLRLAADYPRILLEADEGEQLAFGENGRPKLFDGRLKVEIVTRQTDQIPQPLATLYAIRNRCADLLLGNPADNLPGVCGQRVGPNWRCTIFRQVKPTGLLPVTDPAYKRHGSTFRVQINRVGF